MKKAGILVGCLILLVSIVTTCVFITVSNRQKENSANKEIVSVEPTPVPESTETLFDTANPEIIEQEESVFITNPEDYVDEVQDLAEAELGEIFPEVSVRYVELIDTGVHNHIWEIEHTDIIINVSVTEDCNYTILEPSHRYGSDYSTVWFEVEPVNRIDIYEYLYDVASVSIYTYDANQLLTDITTGEVYDYGLYARTGETGESAAPTGESAAP